MKSALSNAPAEIHLKLARQKRIFLLRFVLPAIRFIPARKKLLIPLEELIGLKKFLKRKKILKRLPKSEKRKIRKNPRNLKNPEKQKQLKAKIQENNFVDFNSLSFLIGNFYLGASLI